MPQMERSTYWNKEEDGSYTFRTQDEQDGECYYQDGVGAFWAWSDWQDESARWPALPEQQKELNEAYAALDHKIRTFQESRQLMSEKGASRGFYPKGKGKGKGKGKNKGQPVMMTHQTIPNMPALSTVLAVQPGTPGYTGYRNCPRRGKGKGGKPTVSPTWWTPCIRCSW